MSKEFLYRVFTSIILLPILFYTTINSGVYLILLLIFFFSLAMYEVIKNTRNILFIIFATILLTLSFYSFYFLRGGTQYSLIVFFWILTTTFLSDIGGYIFGKFFKGKKLTKISPNKTYSGAVGSIILSCLSLPIMTSAQGFYFKELIINFLTVKFLFFAILISLVCQLGDLFVSFLKRKINIKNISNILPGHGGVLDRIDGLIFVLIFCFILKIFGLL
jgi:phosphatidate cytidylyltransferase